MSRLVYGECFRLEDGGPAFFAIQESLLGVLAGWQRLDGIRAKAMRARKMPCQFQKGIFPVWSAPLRSFAGAYIHPVTADILMVERASW
jgi:hypothetical protein